MESLGTFEDCIIILLSENFNLRGCVISLRDFTKKYTTNILNIYLVNDLNVRLLR